MATTDTSWYELIGQKTDAAINLLVQCNYYATAASVKDLADVAITCEVPMTKITYTVCDREGDPVTEGTHFCCPGGVHRFVMKDVLPLEKLKTYETETADYKLSTTVTLATGHEVGGVFALQCYLRTGEVTTQVPQRSMPEQLAAIPVAKAGMTGAQLRQICMDYMKLQTEFPFKFQEDFDYVIASQKRGRRLLGGKVYYGIPYVSRGAGNLYRIAEAYDPQTGALDPKSDIFGDIRLFGNACSGAASMSWARVVTSAYLGYTMFMTEANGFLPVGPYRYPKENVTRFIRNDPNEVCCKTICEYNGEQTMYESYAAMLPADGAVCDGHVRMNSAVPVIVRKEDGTIDGDQSYTLMREQVCYVAGINHLRIAPDGTHSTAQGCVDIRYSFRQLFEKNYVPFTFAEFADPSRVEPARIRLAVEPELRERVLTANYAISDVFVQCNGKRYTYRNMEFFRKEVKMSDIFPEEALTEDSKISCRLYNGQVLEVAQ